MSQSSPLLRLLIHLPLFFVGLLRGAESDVENSAGLSPAVDPIAETLLLVQQHLEQVGAKEDLTPSIKGKLVEAYQSAQTQYQSAQKSYEQEAVHRSSINSLPEETLALESQLASLGETISTNAAIAEISTSLSLPELDQELTRRKGKLATLTSRLASIQELAAQQKARPDAIREQQGKIAIALNEIESALTSAATDGDIFQVPVAERTLLQARKAARQADTAMLEQEILSLPLRSARTSAERNLVNKQIAEASVEVAALESYLVGARSRDAQESEKKAEAVARDAQGKHPLVALLADRNADLTQEHSKLQQRIDIELKPELDALKLQRSELKGDFDRAKEQISLVGLSESLAVLLLDQWRRLPNVRTNRLSLNRRKVAIGEAGLRRFRLEEDLLELPELSSSEQIQAWVKLHHPDLVPEDEAGEIWDETKNLLNDIKTTLTSLVADYDRLLRELGELDFEENRHISQVEEYTTYLDERLLWIPSAGSIRPQTVVDAGNSLRRVCSPANQTEIIRMFRSLPDERPVFLSTLGLLLLVSLGSRSVVRRKEEEYLVGVKRISTDSFGITLKATMMLLLQSAPFAAVLALLGRHLMERETSVEILRGLGVSLLYASIYLFGMLVLLNVCRPKGLGQAHFRWDPKIAEMTRRQLFWFLPVVMLLTTVVDLTEELSGESHRSGLGRLALIVLLLAVSAVLYRTMRPADGILSRILQRSPHGWLVRLQRIWYWAAVLAPLGLAILAALGYQHTAVQLFRRTAITVSFCVGAFVVHQLIWRWFVAKERKLQLEAFLEKRRAAAKDRPDEEEGEETSLPEINEDQLDLRSLNEQTRRLLSSLMSISLLLGVWLVWADVLPALNILNSVELWSVEKVVDGNTVTQPVTLNHLALGFIIIVFTSVAVRNISGVLEVGILQNLPLAAGSRYAIVTIVQYGMVMFGTVMFFKVLGFTLEQFGWMMAALSVGLGFGLQEVVANFVSGVILLAERPIRVGDIVTVSDVSGIVTRIRIRATTITNWDRQELVVPNKEFITGRILNWTLSNTVNRIVIVVGVAYGTDTDRARELLKTTANKHPLIMSDPGPMATFEGFDDSTLRLVLRCYLPNMDNRLSTITELHTAIDQAFAKEGIEISFPQRDLHVRSAPPELFKAPLNPSDSAEKA